MSESDPILLLTGPPGAGKTTIARMIASRLPRTVHLESDFFFHSIVGGYVEPWRPEAHEQNAVVMRIVANAAAGYAHAGYFTIVDGIFIPGWFFEPLRDALLACGKNVAYAVLRASLATCKTRSAGRDQASLVDTRALEQLWNAFVDLGVLERHVIATDNAEPAQVSDLIARDLNRLLTTPDAA